MRLSVVLSLLSSSGCAVKFEDWPDASATSTGSQASKGGATSTGSQASKGGATSTLGGNAGTTALVSGGAANGARAGSTAETGGSAGSTVAAGGRATGGVANGGSTAGGVANGGSTAGGVASGGSATGGVANAGSATGGVANAGSATGGVANAGSATGGVANAGAATGGSTFVASRGQILWLSLNGDRANQGEQPNGLLYVDGRFYATKDSCATVAFDTTTRCVSGTLCAYDGVNWGMAVQFDFRTMGPPTNGKLLWNPEEHDAIGVAWSISGNTTSALQLWVLDMAPAWGTSCTSDPCEIMGPPWGRAGIGLTGGLYFDSMDRDDWNGTGIDYAYDPARVFALQFKIPAVQMPGASFRFCIDQLGIVVPK